MKITVKTIYQLSILAFLTACSSIQPLVEQQLTVKKWEKFTLSFNGPTTSEQATDNPFLNYRLIVHFQQGDKTISLPGFYAADGNAGETSAENGKVWKVHFRPDMEGTWNYTTSFRKGKNIAISDQPNEGEAIAFDGQKGTIKVLPADDHEEGRLQYVGKRYLQYAESGRYFLKGGADSPENFLAYHEIDGTKRYISEKERSGEATQKKELHRYAPHIKDWKAGNPTWQNGKGKGIIGALNYLASKGMNSVYFLTMNIDGDGKDVYPYTNYEERLRFDCSKLAQWEIIFDHMDQLELMQHIVLQETENELMLDKGDTGIERKLYLRELIARFAHHPRLKWNLGEENGPVHWRPEGQSTEQQKAMVNYIKQTDPYKNFVVIHSHSDRATQDKLFTPLLGMKNLDGISMQIADRSTIHETTKRWLAASAKAGKQWVLPMDEIGPYWRGVDPDDRVDNNQDTVRHLALWGNLMAGGAGAEWYFGYKNHNDDLGCEDWRTRDRMWDYTRHALTFFEEHLPFIEMESHDELIDMDSIGRYCFAKPNSVYAIYLPYGESTQLDLENATGIYSVNWYNPRTGGSLINGSLSEVQAGGKVDIGMPPIADQKDWVVLIKRNKEIGFQPLFDGKTLTGWVGNKQSYKVKNGVIEVDPQGEGSGGNLYTSKEYDNFILRFEFQLTPGANNGLGIHAPLEGDAAYEGIELQILDNTADKYANLKPYQYHGSVYGVIPAKRGFLKAIGEWNHQEVILNGTTIKVVLNGTTIVNGDYAEASKDGTIDKRPHPGLKRSSGHIGFLGHGDVVRFRNIRLKELQ